MQDSEKNVTATQDKPALTDAQISAIDRAIAKAKARKDAKSKATEVPVEEDVPEEKGDEKTKRTKKDRPEKKERKARQKKERAPHKTPHMSKIEKAAARLPMPSTEAKKVIDDIVGRLPREDLTAIVEHVQHHLRVKATLEALDTAPLEVGQRVIIVGGDKRWTGKEGTLAKVQRIRCYVNVPGATKLAYLFTSDVRPIETVVVEEPEVEQATGT